MTGKNMTDESRVMTSRHVFYNPFKVLQEIYMKKDYRRHVEFPFLHLLKELVNLLKMGIPAIFFLCPIIRNSQSLGGY